MADYPVSTKLQIHEDGDATAILTATARIAQDTQGHVLGQELHSLLSTQLWDWVPILSQKQVRVASALAGQRGLCDLDGVCLARYKGDDADRKMCRMAVLYLEPFCWRPFQCPGYLM